MKIFLVNPPFIEVYGPYREAAKLGAQPQMPLGLAYIAAVARDLGHNVVLLDADVEGLSIDKVVEKVGDAKPDLVGVSATTPIYSNGREILEKAKEVDDGITTVLGGFHITALPRETMEESEAVDYGIIGEGEETFKELIDVLVGKKDAKDTAGLAYRDEDGTVKINHRRKPIQNLESIPYPARDLLKTERYVWSIPGKGLAPVTSIITTRGCPFQCIFCGVGTMFPGKPRYRRLCDILDEIESVIKKFSITHFMFSDDTLTLDKERVLKFCREVKDRGLAFTFEGYTRADCVDKEILQELKSIGLLRLSFGVESGNQKILDAIKKGTTLGQLKRAYEWCSELGIESRCSLMIGHPFETMKTVEETLKFVTRELKVYQAYVNITTPYPGSELYELAKEGYGGLRLLTDDWSQYRRYGKAVMEMNDLKSEDLVNMQKKFYLRFYLRPHIIWYNIRRAGFKAALVNTLGFFRSVFSREKS
ncbi:MAG: radical SAM protein [Methanobacteriota archaeon]